MTKSLLSQKVRRRRMATPERWPQAIMDNLPFEAWLKDKEGRYLAVNRHFADYLGRPVDEILGRRDRELFPPEEAAVYEASDRAILEGRESGYFESIVAGKWKEEFKAIATDPDGNPIGTSGFARDISQRKAMQKALEDAERSKSLLIAHLPGMAYRCKNDRDWTMTFLSEGCRELTGYEPEELLNNRSISYNELISPEFREYLYEKWNDDIQKMGKSDDEYVIVTKNGQRKWVREQSIPIMDSTLDGGESEGFIIDITGYKELLRELNESESRFRTVFETAPIGIGIFNTRTGEALQFNPKFQEILGRSGDELLRMDWRTYSHPDEIQENIRNLEKMARGELTSFSMDKRYIRPDGEVIWAHMMIVPFQGEGGGNLHLCMIQDITGSKRREEEIIHLSYHDSLTGLYNRTYFEEEVHRMEVSRRMPVSLVMCDINGLKVINDAFGHAEGDRLIRDAAELLRQTCRAEDVIARVGGDEFIILLPGIDAEGAALLAARIEEMCRTQETIRGEGEYPLSISAGYAARREGKVAMEDLLLEAEEMLYRRKNAGRAELQDKVIAFVRNRIRQLPGYSPEVEDCIRNLSQEIAGQLNLRPSAMRQLAMLLEFRDVGMLAAASDQGPGSESDGERRAVLSEMKTERGYRIAHALQELRGIADGILTMQEHWDGTGSPGKRAGEDIPLLARVAAVAAAASLYPSEGDPCWKGRLRQHLALEAGHLYDPGVVEIAKKILEDNFPMGSAQGRGAIERSGQRGENL